MSINIGVTIYGYCEGYFGRDSYHDKVIIAEGPLWILAIESGEKYPELACFDTIEEKNQCIAKWSVPDDYDEDDY